MFSNSKQRLKKIEEEIIHLKDVKILPIIIFFYILMEVVSLNYLTF